MILKKIKKHNVKKRKNKNKKNVLNNLKDYLLENKKLNYVQVFMEFFIIFNIIVPFRLYKYYKLNFEANGDDYYSLNQELLFQYIGISPFLFFFSLAIKFVSKRVIRFLIYLLLVVWKKEISDNILSLLLIILNFLGLN